MGQKKIGAFITLEGEKEFRSAVASCNKNLATMKSEMKLVEAQTAGSANSLATLRKKHETLTKTLEEHEQKEEALRKGLSHAEQEYERVGNALAEYKEKLARAEKSLSEMEQASDTTEEALEEQRQAVEKLNEIVEKGESTYQRSADRVQDWKKQLNNAEAQTIRTTRALNENAAYMKEAEQATDQCATSIDEFGNRANNLADELTKTSTIIKANFINTLVESGKNLTSDMFRSAVQGTLELQEAQNQLQASTGATEQATEYYGETMEKVYKAGYGDSIRDVADAMALVKQYTNETDPSKLQELAEGGMVLQDVFGMDLSESIRGVDALMENMGLTAGEAFDFITKGAQNGLDKSGELADNIAEYSSLWAQAGFSAEEMFTILQNGLDSGAYNLDKVNDYVKEFGISMSDGRIEENLNAFSKGTQDLFQAWKNGEVTTKEVFHSVISDLASMENQQQALTIASNTWSALGEDNAMKVITSLKQANNAYKNVKGTMESIKDIKYDSVANQWKTLGRTFQSEVITPVLKDFLPPAQKGMKVLADNIEVIIPVAKVAGTTIGTMFVVKKSKNLIKDLKEVKEGIEDTTKKVLTYIATKKAETAAETANTVATTAETAATVAQTTATGAATTAQAGLNAVMAANPVGLLVTAIGTVVGALTIFSSTAENAKEETGALGEKTEEVNAKIQDATQGLKDAMKGVEESVDSLNAKKMLSDDLVTELYALADGAGNSAKEIGKMQIIVGELNSLFPDLNLTIDENTGALNKNEAQTKKSIEASLNFAKAQAAQEQSKEIIEELTKADIARYEAEANLEEIGTKIGELDKKRNKISEEATKATEKGEAATVKYNGKLMDSQTALGKIAEKENALNEKREEQEEKLKTLNDTYDAANEKYLSTSEYIQDLTDKMNGNTDATNDNTESKKGNAEAEQKKQEAAAMSIEVAGQETQAYRNLSAAQQEMAVNVTNGVLSMQESVQGALQSQMDMFTAFDGGVQISTEQLLANMQSQVDGVMQWEQNLTALADKGINQGILQKLSEMGPQGSGYVAAFNSMTDEELKKANELWSQSVDIKGMTDQWGQELLASGAENIAGGLENLTPIMEESGANTVMGLVRGMQEAQRAAEASGEDLGVKTIDSVNKGLGCASPSRKTKESGQNVDRGLVNGINAGKGSVQSAAQSVAVAVVGAVRSNLSEGRFYSYGYNVSGGLASGILAGKSQVISAAIEVAAAAESAAKNKLQINSPSKVFKRIGAGTMEGYVLGVRGEMQKVKSTVNEAMNLGEGRGVRKVEMPDNNYRELVNVIQTAAEGRNETQQIVVMIGNEKIDSYIMKTVKKGIYNEQLGSQGARGKRCLA